MVLIDFEFFLDIFENYLRKYRFCIECKLKVLRVYSILVGDLDGLSEKGWVLVKYLKWSVVFICIILSFLYSGY